ncbi:MAG TPA: hypothetical protein VF921_03205 [Vicinamibacterales bacterium]
MSLPRILVWSIALVTVLASPALAADPGKSVGTITIDGVATPLTLAVASSKESFFDIKKTDTVVTLTDHPLGDLDPGDDIGLSIKAEAGTLTAVVLRIDGGKLANVSLMNKGLAGVVRLPGEWFQYSATERNAGTLSLAKREFDGHSYECSVTFTAASTAPAAAPRTAQPQSSSSAPKVGMPQFVEALMKKDEPQALAVVKVADPNSRDQNGLSMLNWAVMVCMPRVVQALVDRKASLTYQRVPGFTIMQEAGACPAAAKILAAAGAK